MLLKPGTLTLKDLRDFSAQDMELELAPADRQRMAQSRQVVEDRIAQDITTYGVNTGFGTLSSHLIGADELAELQRRLVLSNAAGTGEPMRVADN